MAEARISIGGTPRNVKECYAGVGGAGRTVKEIYVGVNGAPRLAWSFGVNRLYFASYTGVGECDIATFAVVKPVNNIAYFLSSLGGMKRRLWAFDNRNSTNPALNDTRMLELDIESRAIIQVYLETNSYLQWTQLGSTVNSLYRANFRITGSPVEIDPNTFAVKRTSPAVEYGEGGHGIAGTDSRLLTFSPYGSSSQNIMHERDPATLGIIRQIASIVRYERHTGIDKQIFSMGQYGVSFEKKVVNQIDIETLAIIRTSPCVSEWQSIGGIKS